MAYVPNYTSPDLGTSVIDVLVTIVLVIGSFAAILALVLLWRFFKGKKLV